MNWDQWKAILWLRWRLSRNQLHRGGALGAVILAILAVMAAFTSIILFFVGLILGIVLLPKAAPLHLMVLWDAMAGGFLFFWLIGVLTELQRSELLSLDKFLHLPVTLRGAFVLNYLSSLVALPVALFLPGMLGVAIAQVVTKGPAMLLVFPLVFGFLFLVTAVTYQFRGWLATLMANKRRRRAIVAFLTAGFILLANLPNLINFTIGRPAREAEQTARRLRIAEKRDIERQTRTGEITSAQRDLRLRAIEQEEAAAAGRRKERNAVLLDRFRTANAIVPPLWLPYGAMAAGETRVVPGVLGFAGMLLIGSASLWRAYHTTLRFYTGGFRSNPQSVDAEASSGLAPDETRPRVIRHPVMLEWRLPGLSEACAAIVVTNLRSLLRAPEVKTTLISPVILFGLMGASAMNVRGKNIPEFVPPIVAIGAVSFAYFSIMGLVQNQFGFDRSGFRLYVLSGIPRRDILLGKNLSIAPICFTIGLGVLVFTECLFPLMISHLVATTLQLVVSFLVLCMIGNFSSLLSPWSVAPGSFKPLNLRGVAILWTILFALLTPFMMSLTSIPLALDLLWRYFKWGPPLPIYLILAILELVLVAVIYWFVLDWQGSILQRRETRILELVTAKAE